MSLICSLSIGQRGQNRVDGHAIHVGEIVFSAQLYGARFVFHVSVLGRSFRANRRQRRERLQSPVNAIYPPLDAIPMGKYFKKRVEIYFPYGKVFAWLRKSLTSLFPN